MKLLRGKLPPYLPQPLLPLSPKSWQELKTLRHENGGFISREPEPPERHIDIDSWDPLRKHLSQIILHQSPLLKKAYPLISSLKATYFGA